jgi:acyl-CoA reductase-like NAD-dependent aldehyde dehydrogenase
MIARQKFIVDIDPSKGEKIDKIKCSSSGEIASAVKLAKKAFKKWNESSLNFKISCLKKISKDISKEKNNIAKMISNEMGKIFKNSIREVEYINEIIEENIKISSKALGVETYRDKSDVTEVHRIPFGIVAIITPWNYPVKIPTSLLIPSILTGNCAVFKPSEYTPLSGKAIYDIFNRYLPKGVVNILQGAEEVGEMLLQSDIDMVAFVGSKEVGKKVMASCSQNLKRIILELGGKDPMIVLKDADIKKAASFAVFGSIKNCGQICSSIERIYVEDKVAYEFERLVLEEIKKIKVGDSYDDVDMGPMANEGQRNLVLLQIDEAKRKGARVLFGGNKINTSGYFIEPTLLVDVCDRHTIMTDETFGPVVAIQRVRNVDEAIEKANKTNYGLGATIWTKSYSKGKELSLKIEAGMIGINKAIDGVSGTPWIGIKQSGFGFHGSVEGFKQFTLPKKISYRQ